MPVVETLIQVPRVTIEPVDRSAAAGNSSGFDLFAALLQAQLNGNEGLGVEGLTSEFGTGEAGDEENRLETLEGIENGLMATLGGMAPLLPLNKEPKVEPLGLSKEFPIDKILFHSPGRDLQVGNQKQDVVGNSILSAGGVTPFALESIVENDPVQASGLREDFTKGTSLKKPVEYRKTAEMGVTPDRSSHWGVNLTDLSAEVSTPVKAVEQFRLTPEKNKGSLEEGGRLEDSMPLFVTTQQPKTSAKVELHSATTEVRESARITVPELFEKVESMVRLGDGKMAISLTPPELGEIHVKVATRGGKVEIEIASENAFAKHVLETHLGELQKSMQSQSLDLSKIEFVLEPRMESLNLGMDLAQKGSAYDNLFQENARGKYEDSSRTRVVAPNALRANESLVASVYSRTNQGGLNLRI